MNGTPASAVNAKLVELEARKVELGVKVARRGQEPKRPRLHPGLAETYRARMAELRAEVEGPGAVAQRETLRAMIKHVAVHADRIELVGELSSLLLTAGLPEGVLHTVARLSLGETQKAANGADVAASFAAEKCSAKWDAGTRNRRSQYIAVAI
jgi:hypothetical protein